MEPNLLNQHHNQPYRDDNNNNSNNNNNNNNIMNHQNIHVDEVYLDDDHDHSIDFVVDDDEDDNEKEVQQQHGLDPMTKRTNNRFTTYRNVVMDQSRKRKNIYTILALVCFSILILLSIIVPVRNKNKRNAASNEVNNNNNGDDDGIITRNGPLIPAMEVSDDIRLTNENEFIGEYIMQQYVKLMIPHWNTILMDVTTPQNKALKWLTSRNHYAILVPYQKIQRYVLATFYYSTYYQDHEYMEYNSDIDSEIQLQDWTSSNHWLSNDIHECQWEGIVCNGNNTITSISLPNHALSGSLPIELGMLTNLIELDFTSNYIYVDGDDTTTKNVFHYLHNLKELRMDDNYIVCSTGLPYQFSYLTKIQFIQVSYNLLQGEMNGTIFTTLQQLKSIELESNYLSGSIPKEMSQLPNLLYFYGRRNFFNFKLHEYFTPQLPSVSSSSVSSATTTTTTGSTSTPIFYPSLYSVWLDNNENITGSIPSTIGLLTNLASISITNASLTGSIPSTFSALTSLKRVWLYDNELMGTIPSTISTLSNLEVFEVHGNQMTGSMPPAICEYISNSDYQYRTSSADCDSVDCQCCTICY